LASRLHVLWAFLLFLACTVVLTYPVVVELPSTLPHDPGDPVLETWFLWWSTHVRPLTRAWWNSGFFYPMPDVMTFSENLLGILPITAPVQFLTGNPVLAYNVAFLCTFPLSALGAYLLCLELTGRRDASLIAGLAFGFAPYRIEQLPHLQVLTAYWLPMAFFALHRYLRDRRVRWLALFALLYLLQGLSNGYLLLYMPVIVLLWTLWFARGWRDVVAIGLAGAAALVVLAPILLKYSRVHEQFGFLRTVGEIQFYSADLTAILAPAPLLTNWQSLRQFARPEGQLFPGLTIIAVIVTAMVLSWRKRRPEWPTRYRVVDAVLAIFVVLETTAFAARLAVGPWELFGGAVSVSSIDRSALLILLAVLLWALGRLIINRRMTGRWPSFPGWVRRVGTLHAFLTVALWLTVAALALRLLLGPWRVELAFVKLSVDRVDKTIATIAYVALLWLLTTPRALAARRHGSAFPFYVLASVIVYLLAMGPVPSLGGDPIFYQAPYGWLMNLPGFEGLRVPARIWIVAVMCLAIAGGLAFVRLVPASASAVRRYACVLAIGTGILADTWISAMPTVAPPRRSPILERHASGPLIEVPLGDHSQDLEAMYRSIFHHRLVGNGYSGFYPPHYAILAHALAGLEPDLPVQLAALGFREVSVNRRFDHAQRLEHFFTNASDVRRVAGDEQDVLFRLPAAPPLTTRIIGAPLEVASVRASFNGALVGRMLDGDLQSRWDGGLQEPGQEVVIDLGSTKPINSISLGLGPHTTDYPRLLSIEVSDDQRTWSEVWKGPTAARSLLASAYDPKWAAVRFDIDRSARWIRLRQHGSDPVYFWSIAELSVH
jgi:hypothetical protein